MDIKRFLSSEIAKLTDFAEWWDNQRKVNPQDFPEELPPCEWIDQYESWLSLQEEPPTPPAPQPFEDSDAIYSHRCYTRKG
jgi:hypothetical protein